ncbi:MAG: nitroreductase family protein [Miltoncostaeaceae bacterium]
MDADEAIRLRRSVRSYTDQPVPDADIDAILRLALLAPTGGMAQAWSLIVVREPELRKAVAEIVIRGGAKYFETVRPPAPDVSPDEHAEWARGYAEQVLGNYRDVSNKGQRVQNANRQRASRAAQERVAAGDARSSSRVACSSSSSRPRRSSIFWRSGSGFSSAWAANASAAKAPTPTPAAIQ